jgi:hypothetical protein
MRGARVNMQRGAGTRIARHVTDVLRRCRRSTGVRPGARGGHSAGARANMRRGAGA